MPRRKTRNPKSTSQGDVSEAVQSSAEKPEGSDAQSSASQTTLATITGLNEKQWKSTIGSLPSAMRDVKGALYRARTAASNATEANWGSVVGDKDRMTIIQASKDKSISFNSKSGLSTIAERLKSSVTTGTTLLPVFDGPAEEHFQITRNVDEEAEAREFRDRAVALTGLEADFARLKAARTSGGSITVKVESDDESHTESGEGTVEDALAALRDGRALSKYSNLLEDPEYKANHDAYLKSMQDPTAAESQEEASAAPEGSEDVFETALQALQSGKASQRYGERMMDPELNDAYLRKLEEEGSEDDDL